MEKVNILHHYDADGRASGAVARWFLKDAYELNLVEIEHGQPLPVFLPGSTWMVLDFSLPRDVLEKALSDGVQIIWCDHHITAIEKLKDHQDLPGIRTIEHSGCVLTWLWCSEFGKKFFPKANQSLGVVHPSVIFVGDRDTWKWEFPETKLFGAGLMTYDIKPTSPVWEDLFSNRLTIAEVIKRGEIYNEALAVRNAGLILSKGFSTMIDGYRAFCLNASGIGRDSFDAVLAGQGYDLYVLFTYNGKYWKYTAYTAGQLDVSNIAVLRGGGGHKGACGWESNRLEF